jgi:hypothetical protein
MTGFARAAGNAGPWRCVWEVRWVNAKGLDMRLRLAPPFDAIEPEARQKIAAKFARGTVHAALNAEREMRLGEELLKVEKAKGTRGQFAGRKKGSTATGGAPDTPLRASSPCGSCDDGHRAGLHGPGAPRSDLDHDRIAPVRSAPTAYGVVAWVILRSRLRTHNKHIKSGRAFHIGQHLGKHPMRISCPHKATEVRKWAPQPKIA